MKLFVKLLLSAAIFIGASVLLSEIFILIFALVFQNKMKFSALICLLISVTISLLVCISMRKFVKEKSYFDTKDLDTGHNFWLDCIKREKYITKKQIYILLIPYFVIGAFSFILFGIFYHSLQHGGEHSYIGFAALIALISALGTSSIIYAILCLHSMKICKICGAVNAFIVSENIEHVASVSYGDYRVPAGLRGASDMSSIRSKTENHADRILCHCASCKNETIITERYDSTWSGA